MIDSYKLSDDIWESLSEEQQRLMFYSVIKRLYQYRVLEGRSYRGTLYDGFGFSPTAYAMGMECNFLDLHNMLYDALEYEAMEKVNRFEVIDSEGRSYVNYLKEEEAVQFSLQDNDRTLKVFISNLGV